MAGGVITIADTDFETEVLNANGKSVLVYFWANWCGPCRLVSPSIDWLATEYSDRLKVIKMEIDANPATVAQYKVEGVPAIRLFHKGQLIESWEGAITRQKLAAMVEPHLAN